jgi:hypothetical protein
LFANESDFVTWRSGAHKTIFMSKVKRPLCLAPATQLFSSRAALLVGLLLLLAYCLHISGSSRRTSDSNDNSHIGRKRNINSSAHAKLANDTMFVGLLDTLLVAVSSHAETAAKVGPDFWNNMGNIAEVRQEVLDFLSYADQPCIKTLCEVGFNAGHSATVLLSANDTTVLHVFDMASLPFASAQVKLMKRVYGKRFHFYKGDSVNLLPWFQQHKTHCDLFSIDGDHTYEGTRCRHLSMCTSVLTPNMALVKRQLCLGSLVSSSQHI